MDVVGGPPPQIAAACDGVRVWAEENDWPLDRRVELERTIQRWAFDIVHPA